MQIELQHVSKNFGHVVALEDVTLTIPSGQRVALLGPNGSGKSTLIRALMGMIAVEGRVRVDGQDPFENRLHVAKQVAYVPQNPPQFSATVGELMGVTELLRELPSTVVEGVARRLNLEVEAIRNRAIRDLSGGTKQKLMLALALASGASLLILDEPASSLDVQTRRQLFALLEDVAPDATVLLCSHRLEEVRSLVSYALVLDCGRIAYHGAAVDEVGSYATAAARVSQPECVSIALSLGSMLVPMGAPDKA